MLLAVNSSFFNARKMDSLRFSKSFIRSSSAKREFMKESGYPEGRPGYVVDHIKPLKNGGCDCPENMQWQTKEEAKEKDKWE